MAGVPGADERDPAALAGMHPGAVAKLDPAAGENPAQSVALAASHGKLFGVQLNDGHAKLGAEDGLMFGTVHGHMAVEFLRWLQKVRFDGHIYFDTFPRNEDPVREAEFNIRRVKALWAKAAQLTAAGLDEHTRAHDAMGAMELLERMEAGVE